MKYLKSYKTLKYKIGDIIILDTYTLIYKYPFIGAIYKSLFPNTYDSNVHITEISDIDISRNKYIIQQINDDGFLQNFYLQEDWILRLATPEESEKYKLYNIAKKYNL